MLSYTNTALRKRIQVCIHTKKTESFLVRGTKPTRVCANETRHRETRHNLPGWKVLHKGRPRSFGYPSGFVLGPHIHQLHRTMSQNVTYRCLLLSGFEAERECTRAKGRTPHYAERSTRWAEKKCQEPSLRHQVRKPLDDPNLRNVKLLTGRNFERRAACKTPRRQKFSKQAGTCKHFDKIKMECYWPAGAL